MFTHHSICRNKKGLGQDLLGQEALSQGAHATPAKGGERERWVRPWWGAVQLLHLLPGWWDQTMCQALCQALDIILILVMEPS